MVVPIRYNRDKDSQDEGPSSLSSSSSYDPNGTILSSKVLSLTYNVDGDVITMDVECVCDGSTDRRVPLNRVKINTDPPVPTPFLLSLQDIMNRVAALTPSRADLHQILSQAIDFPMWTQMISNSALTPTDIHRTFSYIFSCIVSLMAPIRLESFNQWTSTYLRLISACSTFDSMVPLLPLMFEFTCACVDEIKRDVSRQLLSPILIANYYRRFLLFLFFRSFSYNNLNLFFRL